MHCPSECGTKVEDVQSACIVSRHDGSDLPILLGEKMSLPRLCRSGLKTAP